MPSIKDYISFNSDFRDSVNLYLDLNKIEKIKSYIPTKSSIDIMRQYLNAVLDNKNHSTLLIGPYGKGKSHLLLLILAILSMERNDENKKLIEELSIRINEVSPETANTMKKLWSRGKFLPVLIMSTQGDLNQAFMVGLNEALKREGLSELTPETYYTYALDSIKRWKDSYPATYKKYVALLKERKVAENAMYSGLTNCEANYLDMFKEIYPELTSGGVFNPLVNSEVLPMYKNIADKLVEEYGYSGIYIVFDEFSKYIEGQDKEAAGNNMKLLQDMCELANSSKQTQVYITMVAHKGIKEYGKYLSMETINSFTGIEGRLREILFVTSSKNNFELIQNAIYKKKEYEKEVNIAKQLSDEKLKEYYGLVAFSSVFTQLDFEEIVLRGCYPLSPTSAYLLLNISEKVAQNERTLFTFISKKEQHSMAKYVDTFNNVPGNPWIICADLIYDYFKALFKKDLNNEFVHNEWLNAEYALSQVDDYDQKKMLKTLAIISIVNKPEEMPADANTLRLAAYVTDSEKTIQQLVEKDLIYKKGSNNCYVFKTRAASELKTEIKKRKLLKAGRINVGNILSLISEERYVLPKRYNDKYTMTRYFRYEYMNVSDFLELKSVSVLLNDELFCDGKVVALYSEEKENYTSAIEEKMKTAACNKLVVVYSHKKMDIQRQLQEYEVLQEIKADTVFFANEENRVLEKEIPIIEEDLSKEIEAYLEYAFGERSGKKVFYFEGEKLRSTNKKRVNDVVDLVCGGVYHATVSVNNELINKQNISTSPIKKARKTIMETLINGEDTEVYMSGTSAESTIYRALFVGTGIRNNHYAQNVENVINIFNDFIASACDCKKCMSDLLSVLTMEPIGMRKGVIPIYLAYALSERNEDVVIYFGKKEQQLNSDILLNMCENPEDYYIFVSSDDVQKEQYLSTLGQLFDAKEKTNKAESRITGVLLAMQRWFRALPQATKNIKKNNEYWDNAIIAQAFPKVKILLQSMDANPYEVLFVELPKAIGSDDYFVVCNVMTELRQKANNYLSWISQRAIEETIRVFDKKAKQDLHHTMMEWYEQQSDLAKHGLHSSQVTGLMTCIAENKTYDDVEFVKRIIRAVTDVHLDTWNETSLEEYINMLNDVKEEIENLGQVTSNTGKNELSFVSKNGESIVKYYECVDESTGAILRNILSDTLDDFSDLSVNDKIAILLEMIEKELG
ncbi:MAG: hypothetical protein K2N61_07255 [Lachnospiraceae bacterium]|nr:hypothetical protein [Lachnospiraceae bacterium]